MADVRLTPEKVTDAGLAATYTGSLSIADTYLVQNDGAVILHFKKTGAGACTVTVVTPKSGGRGLAIADRTFSVPATTGDVFAGPFPVGLYNDGSGDLSFTLSEITGLTVAVLRVRD